MCSYKRNISGLLPGGSNKGIRLSRVKKREAAFKAGLPIFCKKHGEHCEWVETINKAQIYPVIRCKKCINDCTKNYVRKNYLKILAAFTKRRDSKSEITEDFLQRLLKSQNNCCALTGIKFDENNKPSVDRIDSSVGYIENNIQLVLFDINRMKSAFPLDYFILRCTQVAEKAKNGKIPFSIKD